MLNDVKQWLEGPRNYEEGVTLYLRYGQNRRLRYVFTHQTGSLVMDMLVEQLRIIAGISETAMRCMQRRAARASARSTALPAGKTSQQASGETMARIRFRERFPFLSDTDCPDVLKVAVADLFTAYGKYRDGHAALVAMTDDAPSGQSLDLCRQVVDNYLTDRAIMAELDYYAKHHELLGEAAVVRRFIEQKGLDSLSDADLIKQRASAAANLSKAKKRLAASDDDHQAAALLDKWTARKKAIDGEIEKRKKK